MKSRDGGGLMRVVLWKLERWNFEHLSRIRSSDGLGFCTFLQIPKSRPMTKWEAFAQTKGELLLINYYGI